MEKCGFCGINIDFRDSFKVDEDGFTIEGVGIPTGTVLCSECFECED